MPLTGFIARDIDAPEGGTPVGWGLLTKRKAETFEAVVEGGVGNRCRWETETFFKGFKNGRRGQALQLGQVARIELALAVYRGGAWRPVRLGRTHPALETNALFTGEEW